MTLPLTRTLAGFRSHLNAGIFMPLVLVFTLIAVVHTLQSIAMERSAAGPLSGAVPVLFSNVIYYWFFAFLALVVQRHSRRLTLTRRTALRWSSVHAATLVCSFLVLLFNHPAVWIETFAYAIFLLGFSLIDSQRINRENEIRCAELEARLTQARLQELRLLNHVIETETRRIRVPSRTAQREPDGPVNGDTTQ